MKIKMMPTAALWATACLLVAAASACSSQGGNTKDMAAAEAAKEIYDSLRNGGYAYFTDMTYRSSRIPEGYRSQLIANSKMYIHDLEQEHGGIAEIRVNDCRPDSLNANADAFLLLCFNDSTKEEIVVPMMKHGEKWMMR